MKQEYSAFFFKDSMDFYIVTEITFDEYNDMSEKVKEYYKYENKQGAVSPDDWNCWRSEMKANFGYFFGDLLEHSNTCSDTKQILNMISDLYDGLSDYFKQQTLRFLYDAKRNCLEYMTYNNFSIEFLELFSSSKDITLSRRLTKPNGQRFNINDSTTDVAYRYDGRSMCDIIFATIHFALENGYKFMQCEHCGRWFFKDGGRSGSRKKYCNRKSTFSGYEHLECEQAVKNIKQELQRKKKRIYNSLTREAPSTVPVVYEFLDKCAAYMEKIKKEASVQNLSNYWLFLKNYKDGVGNGSDK